MAEAEPVDPTAAAQTAAVELAQGAKKGHRRGNLMRGSIFEIGGYGAQQVLRLGSNLILTRLMYPAAFGLATMVFLLVTGLTLIAETGFAQCVVQSERGDEESFLNTVFTFHAVRGVVLAGLMVALAKPYAWFNHEPRVENLVYLGSLQLLFNGFHATSLMTMQRHMRFGWNNALDLGQQIINITVMLLIARHHPVPAALVLGGVVGTFCYGIATHLLPVGYRNRFHWDREAARELGRFGRWVVGSNAAAFFGTQSDRLLLGRFLGAAFLGFYGIALNLTEAINSLVFRMTSGVLYPALSQVIRDKDKDLPSFYYRFRLRLDLLSMAAPGFLGGVGPWIVHALWDSRYANASWIVQILAVKVAIVSLLMAPEWVIIAHGFTRNSFGRSITRLVANLVFMPIGWHYGGAAGVVWATTAAEVPTVLALWPKARTLGCLRLGREALSIVIFLAALALGHGVARVLPPLHIR